MTTPLIEASGIEVRLGRRPVLDAVDFRVEAGQLLCLLGPNGAGKSTLLRVLAGDLAPSRGNVRFAGRTLRDWGTTDLARRRAVMTQKPATAFEFTSRDVVLLGRYPHCAGAPGQRDHGIATAALDAAEARHLDGRIVTTLSGGENARVHFARTLAQVAFETDAAPRALFLDEPTASLDLAHQHALMRLARSLARERGLAVVAVVHDLNLAARYADRVALLAGGRVVLEGLPLEVLQPAPIRHCFGVDVVSLLAEGHDTPALLVTG